MPVYDYHCKDCGHDFVVVESLDEHKDHESTEPKCPECESANVERVIASVNTLMIESAIKRIGTEQELFLVDRGWRPNPVSLEVLEGPAPEVFTAALTQFDLGINVPPLVWRRAASTTARAH